MSCVTECHAFFTGRRLLCGLVIIVALPLRAAAEMPDEPIEIGTQPQLFVDDHLVDNRFAVKGSGKHMVLRKFHAPVKHGDRAVLRDPDTVPSQHAFRFDREAKRFRIWYQAQFPLEGRFEKKPGAWPAYRHIRYAESPDAIHWTLPDLGLVEYCGNTRNNICFARSGQFSDPRLLRTTGSGISSMRFLNEDEMPAADRRGYKYLMTYTLRGGGKEEEDQTQVYLIGSKDGIQWDREGQMSILTGAISDGWMGMNYDPERKKYVSYCRPRDRYEGGPYKSPRDADFLPVETKHSIYAGVVRRIGRMERSALWTQEEAWSRTIFLPDEVDQKNEITSHMSMKVKLYGGVYFGFLIPYVPKELLWTDLVLSRDGKSFERTHQPFIPTGAAGAWDSGQAWVTPDWVEVGDEWWITYHGANSAPNVAIPKDTTWGIGLAKIRKEGFVSLRTPDVGGVVITKLLKWPGGDLLVNCDTSQGEMRVRVSNKGRHAFDGFNYSDCVPFTGNSVAHRVKWIDRSLDALKEKEVRFEFYFSKQADLYSFRSAKTP
ncbi:MAG: hypothetical protein FJ388_12310 [Verrucomicrobia bacterium]|nr:hypothetical protein [Verrucomicrobiota bacterium]